MLHNRTWFIREVSCPEVAAQLIKQYQNEAYGLRIGELLLLNDFTGTGTTEYAVVDEPRALQIDSWTMDWMSQRETEHEIRTCLAQHQIYEAMSTYKSFDNSMIVNRPLNA